MFNKVGYELAGYLDAKTAVRRRAKYKVNDRFSELTGLSGKKVDPVSHCILKPRTILGTDQNLQHGGSGVRETGAVRHGSFLRHP